MTSSAPTPTLADPPEWPHCGQGATPDNPVGCPGIRVGYYNACLAHLNDSDLNNYLTLLIPNSSVDHRGTTFTAPLWERLIDALRDPSNSRPRIHSANFEQAIFNCTIEFNGALFLRDAQFSKAIFNSEAKFQKTTFQGAAKFHQTKFTHAARFTMASFHNFAQFDKAAFEDGAFFDRATFSEDSQFSDATFHTIASFTDSLFNASAQFAYSSFNGHADFNNTHFKRDLLFIYAKFSEGVSFQSATFTGEAFFQKSRFAEDARFMGVTFEKTAAFIDTRFEKSGDFSGSKFNGKVWFPDATSGDTLTFDGSTFSGSTQLERIIADVGISFFRTRFDGTPHVGPLICGQRVDLDGAVFQQPVTLEISAPQVSCVRTRWASTATLRLREAELDLSDSVFEYPVLVTAHPTPFPRLPSLSGAPPLPPSLPGRSKDVCLLSVEGVDAALLVLNDIDLSLCRFAGAVHLDQLKVDGRCAFATSPAGWSRRFPWKWSRRNTLLEEHHWRVRTSRHTMRAATRWTAPSDEDPDLKPATVAALYRQLRKSLEDGKNEPDAADFYYGECEMRRHDFTRPRGERLLLRLYWALSGYGLRATRALAWLGVSVAVTMAVMMLWGLPVDDPKPATTGRQVAVGQEISLVTDTPKPVNPTNALVDRITTERFEKSVRVVINSVVFRSSGQNLTTAGTYAEMISRLTEPVLLGLAVLAIRSRVKR
ncbi:pentapeptide repeat-containing protein [Streptomyces cinereoruber]|uniref:pentapeptide repeat-containing protein n=1 Tax=Streptomyces cinereoruber TaxID=67260 RepID=UPI0036435892